MSQLQRQPLSYASPGTSPAPAIGAISWRTILAAGWFVVLLYAVYVAYTQISADQATLVTSGASLLGPSLGSAQMGMLLLTCLLPIFWTLLIGAIAAVALWHWPRTRLGWLALLPSVAVGWTFAVSSVSASSPSIVSILLLPIAVALLQGLCIWLGTWWGRWVFRRLAALLLPPSLAAELLPLWRD